MVVRVFISSIICILMTGHAVFADQQDVSILYPKEQAVVGSRVNLVLDPATNWSAVPFFQVLVGKTEYPIVDTSTMKHAIQGLKLEPGVNTIIVKLLAPDDKKRKKNLTLLSTTSVKVYSKADILTGGEIPIQFEPKPFHSREDEAGCSGCHRLDVQQGDFGPAKPQEMICYACHRTVPVGEHIHGPAAVWGCLSCHDPELYPIKYQFKDRDPWKVTKTTQPVKPAVFTFPSADLFKPASARFKISRRRARKLLRDALSYIRRNPRDKIRLEVHTDNKRIRSKAFRKKYKNLKGLSAARAKALAGLFRKFRIPGKRIHAVGMGAKLPKAPNITRKGRELNNRIEIVVHPSSVRVRNSMRLPVLKKRKRVVVNLTYSHTSPAKNVRVVEKLPKGMTYVKGTSFFKGRIRDPKRKGRELTWKLGDMGEHFKESLFYVVKKRKRSLRTPSEIKLVYVNNRERVRVFDPKAPSKRALTISEACTRCHQGMLAGTYKHGPTDAGYCTICHDPHASPNPAWLIKPSWDICVTCHSRLSTDRHVVAGIVDGDSHPTKKKKDPSRPGKRLTCTSCHEPHSGEHPYLFAQKSKTRFRLCKICHGKV